MQGRSRCSQIPLPALDKCFRTSHYEVETSVKGGVELNVIEGRADLAFNLISKILPVAGVELVGPLPAELQSYVAFTSGIGVTSNEPEVAKTFVVFLKGPVGVPVLKAKGMEPA
jgi:ABC-type molybdate transport system substrate-binding protein